MTQIYTQLFCIEIIPTEHVRQRPSDALTRKGRFPVTLPDVADIWESEFNG